MVDSSVLGQYSLFDGLESGQIDSILPMMHQETFEAGTDIIIEDKHNDRLYFILDGNVALVKKGVILLKRDKGDIFGELEVLDTSPAEATVKALVATKVMSLSVDALGEIYEKDLKAYSFLLTNLARDVARRLRYMNNRIVSDDTHHMEWS